MRRQFNQFIKILFVALILVLISTPVWSTEVWTPPHKAFTYIVIVIVFLGAFLAINIINSKLSRYGKWSLSDALSEEVEVTAMEEDQAGVTKPKLDSSGKPIMIKELRASSSRMVALMGMIVILLMFIGFGAFSLYSFANTGKMPSSINEVIKFLLAGLTLFAPYVVNKFSSVFKSFIP